MCSGESVVRNGRKVQILGCNEGDATFDLEAERWTSSRTALPRSAWLEEESVRSNSLVEPVLFRQADGEKFF